MMEQILLWLIFAAAAAACALCCWMAARLGRLQERIGDLEKQGSDGAALLSRQDLLIDTVRHSMDSIKNDLSSANLQTDQKLDFIRRGMENALTQIRRENAAQIGEIRATVDEKLQDVL